MTNNTVVLKNIKSQNRMRFLLNATLSLGIFLKESLIFVYAGSFFTVAACSNDFDSNCWFKFHKLIEFKFVIE